MSAVIEESTELVTLPPQETALAVYSTAGGLNPLIEQIRAKVAGTVYDMATAKGRDECRSDAAKVGRSKQAIERMGKELSAYHKEVPKKIDAERKRAFDELEALQKQVRQPLTDWEEAEERRVASYKAGIQAIVDCGNGLIGGQPQPFGMLFYELEQKIVIDSAWEEFEAEAHRAKADALVKLKTEFAEHQKREAEQAELARLRAEADEREQRDREAQIAREAEERTRKEAEAKAQAERDAATKAAADAKAAADRRELELKLQAETAERERLQAIQKAEQDRADAIERAEQERKDAEDRQRQAVDAERQRQADEAARAEAEARAREADKAHKAKVNNTAMAAFIAGGLSAEAAKLAVMLIATKKVPAVSITY